MSELAFIDTKTFTSTTRTTLPTKALHLPVHLLVHSPLLHGRVTAPKAIRYTHLERRNIIPLFTASPFTDKKFLSKLVLRNGHQIHRADTDQVTDTQTFHYNFA